MLNRYFTPTLDSIPGDVAVAGALAHNLGVQALSGIKGLSELPHGAGAAADAIREYQRKYAVQASPELTRGLRSMAPAYYAAKDSPVGHAAHAVGKYYDEGTHQLSDLVGKYLGPTAAGVAGAAGEVAPMMVNPEGLLGKAAAEGATLSMRGADEAGLFDLHPDAQVIDAHDHTGQHLGRMIVQPDSGRMHGMYLGTPHESVAGQLLRKAVDHAHDNDMDFSSPHALPDLPGYAAQDDNGATVIPRSIPAQDATTDEVPQFGDGGAVGSAIGDLAQMIERFTPAESDIVRNGGITLHPATGQSANSGYAVSLHKNRESILPHPPAAADLANYTHANRDAFESDPNAHLGVWANGDKHYLDVAHIDPDFASAVGKAKANNQLAIFDLAHKEEIPTTPDVSHFVHYGNPSTDKVTLDPQFMGTGISGMERRRGGPKVTALYAADNSAPEHGLESKTKYAVTVPSDRLYPADSDPLGLKADSTYQGNLDMADYEHAIKGAGYAGYHTPDAQGVFRGQARMFEPVQGTRIGGAPAGDEIDPWGDQGGDEISSAGPVRPRPAGTPDGPPSFAEGGEVGAALGSLPDMIEEAAPLISRQSSSTFPDLMSRYPEGAPPQLATDAKTGKQFLQKQLSPEAQDVSQARVAAQRDINQGNYQPYFDPDRRYDVDPGLYPQTTDTLAITPKKQVTTDKYAALAGAPDARSRLVGAYESGLPDKGASNWYMMGQLADRYTKLYGPEIGPQMFKSHFADAMAATTGGADPTSNLVMAHYGNYLKGRGEPVPEAAHEMPFPIGGRYASGNMGMYNRVMNEGTPLGDTNPKRVNFSANFQGHPDRATIDEQMSRLFDPKLAAPAPGTYGVYEQALHDLAKEHGVDPRFFQEVAWAGAKKQSTPNYVPKSMIQIVNEAIERTHRITGMEHDDIADGMVRGDIPLFGVGGHVGLDD